MPNLSKSNFLKGRQCSRRLWLAVIRPPEPAVDPDEVWEMRVEQGAEVERVAADLFPGVIRIVDASEEEDGTEQRPEIARLVERTRTAMREHRPIAQACLQVGQLLSITDILEPRGDGWYLWEVKASTSLKPSNDWDLAFQAKVARQSGLRVVGAGVLRLDGAYVRGTELEPARLLKQEDRTEQVLRLEAEVRVEIAGQAQILTQSDAPLARPGTRCRAYTEAADGKRPSTCGQLGDTGFCGRELPKRWVGRLPNLKGVKAARVEALQDQSIEGLDADDEVFDWTSDQRRDIVAVKSGRPVVDTAALRRELAGLTWPVAYVDFEYDPGMAVPRFPGCRPYDKLPFQWSMLVQSELGGELDERGPFLHLDTSDPRRVFAEALLAALPGRGTIVAHSKAAEIGVINQLADRLGGAVADQLRTLVTRFFDTKALAKAGYYHPDQHGSWSIKKLAPALLGTGYTGLAIQNGLAAVAAWKSACREGDREVRERLRASLLAYCGRDTSLMHGIVERLREISEGKGR